MSRNLLLTVILAFFALISFGQVSSENVNFTHGGCKFKGTLTTPSGNGPHKTIVLVPGSGQNDRNGTIAMTGANANCLYPKLVGSTLEIYKDLALQLTDSGYAVLCYDELGISCPGFTGTLNYETLFLPALSALDYLKTRPDIDTNNLILVGHSEGAALIPYMASKTNDIKAMVSLAGARTPFDSLLASQLVYIARTCNGDTASAKTQAQQVLTYFDIVRKANYNANTPPFGGLSAPEWHKYINVNDSVSLLYQQSNTASLFIGLGQDINVPPSELVRFQNELNGNFSFYSIPGLTHYMTNDSLPEVSPKIGDTIVYWLRGKTMGAGGDFRKDRDAVKCYPNPFTDEVKVHLGETVPTGYPVQIRIIDSKGREVFKSREIRRSNDEDIRLALPDLAAGIYELQCKTEKKLYIQKIFKIRR